MDYCKEKRTGRYDSSKNGWMSARKFRLFIALEICFLFFLLYVVLIDDTSFA
jgi:hypothetical protein